MANTIHIGGSSSGSGTYSTQDLTSSGSATGWNYMVRVNATSGNIVVSLPSAISTYKGQSIVIKKMDNSNNTILVQGFNSGTETIDGQVTGIYLYNQNDSVVVIDNGDNTVSIYADNRNSTGSTVSYMYATMTAPQTNPISAGSLVLFNNVKKQIGSKATLNTTTGILTLKAGSVFSVKGSLQSVSMSSAGVAGMSIQTSTDGSTYTTIQSSDMVASSLTWTDADPSAIISTVVDATVDTYVKCILTSNTSGVSALGNGGALTYSLPWLEVNEISRQATVINSVDYISAYQSATQLLSTGGAQTTTLTIDTKTAGNLSLNGDNTVTLIAGKTYTLIGGVGYSNTADIDIGFYDVTNSKHIQTNGTHLSTGQNGTISVHYTPNVNSKIALIAKFVPTTGTEGLSSAPRYLGAWFTITQVGSTATTNVPLSLVGGITDNSSSNYMDIGNMRYQWGTTTGTSITFPVPFKDTTYTCNPTVVLNNTNTLTSVFITTKSPTGVNLQKSWYNGGSWGTSLSCSVDWIAIGLKP